MAHLIDSPLLKIPGPLEINRRIAHLLREVSLLKRLQRLAVAAERDLAQEHSSSWKRQTPSSRL